VTYELIFDRKAVEFLESLPKELRQRIFDKVAAAKENPMYFFERLEGRQDYKLRVGDYRVIADINHGLKQIEVTLIDHRKRVYKRLLKETRAHVKRYGGKPE
jgi:mRNA interferase RelE/StbE